MKMIFAIVRKEDEGFVIERLNKEKISVTKLSSTGGFLRKGNATLMIGTEDEKVDTVLQIIKEECARRKEVMINPTYSAGSKGPVLGYAAPPVTIDVGGATVFIVNVVIELECLRAVNMESLLQRRRIYNEKIKSC